MKEIIKGLEDELRQLKLRLANPNKFRVYATEAGGEQREVTAEIAAQEQRIVAELERLLAELKKQ